MILIKIKLNRSCVYAQALLMRPLGIGSKGRSFCYRFLMARSLMAYMTAGDLLQALSIFPATAPLVIAAAANELCTFDEEQTFTLLTPRFEAVTSVSRRRGGLLLLHAESHDERSAPRLRRGALTVGDLREILDDKDGKVLALYCWETTCIEAITSVRAEMAISGGEGREDYEYGETGRVRVNCQSAEASGYGGC